MLTSLLGNPVRAYNKANHNNKRKLVNSIMKDIKIIDNKIFFKWKISFLKLV